MRRSAGRSFWVDRRSSCNAPKRRLSKGSKPAWTPPSWLFGPVWMLLYLMMAVALWVVWSRLGFARAMGAITLFFVQLALNAAWVPVFFGARSIQGGLVVVVLFVLGALGLGWALIPLPSVLLRVALALVGLVLPELPVVAQQKSLSSTINVYVFPTKGQEATQQSQDEAGA